MSKDLKLIDLFHTYKLNVYSCLLILLCSIRIGSSDVSVHQFIILGVLSSHS